VKSLELSCTLEWHILARLLAVYIIGGGIGGARGARGAKPPPSFYCHSIGM